MIGDCQDVALFYVKDDFLKPDTPLSSELGIFFLRPIKHAYQIDIVCLMSIYRFWIERQEEVRLEAVTSIAWLGSLFVTGHLLVRSSR